MVGRIWIAIGAGMGALGVTLGAFGAHALTGMVEKLATTAAEQQHLIDVWETAVRYQMYHALALVLVGVLAGKSANRLLGLAGSLFLTGIVVFSGLLYGLVVTGVRVLGAIVPLGGLALIGGWIVLAIASWRLLPVDVKS